MARKPETVFITSVEKYLPSAVHHEKMANPYRGGTADSWYDGCKADQWIEWKFIVVPKRSTTLIDPYSLLSSLQQDWLKDRCLNKRRVAVIVGCKDGGVIFTDMTWTMPISPENFINRLQTRKQLADWITSRVT